jgi:hypothetical protein
MVTTPTCLGIKGLVVVVGILMVPVSDKDSSCLSQGRPWFVNYTLCVGNFSWTAAKGSSDPQFSIRAG